MFICSSPKSIHCIHMKDWKVYVCCCINRFKVYTKLCSLFLCSSGRTLNIRRKFDFARSYIGHPETARLLDVNTQSWKGKHPFRDSGLLTCLFVVIFFLAFVIFSSSFLECGVAFFGVFSTAHQTPGREAEDCRGRYSEPDTGWKRGTPRRQIVSAIRLFDVGADL